MSFDSFSEFLNMGGHGLYVWLCYGIGLLVFLIAYVQPLMQRKSILRELSQIYRRTELKNKQTAQTEP